MVIARLVDLRSQIIVVHESSLYRCNAQSSQGIMGPHYKFRVVITGFGLFGFSPYRAYDDVFQLQFREYELWPVVEVE